MSFYGKAFEYNGVSSEEFGLMTYSFDGSGETHEFASTVTIQEDLIPSRAKPMFYGVTYEQKQELTLEFGVNQKRLDEGRYLDREEMSLIASWLSGHSDYKWLMIDQEDMQTVRYRSIVTSLSPIEDGGVCWGMKAVFTCDSPYGYRIPQTYTFRLNGTKSIQLLNESSHNGYYYPRLVWEIEQAGSLIISNSSDGGRTFSLSDIPQSAKKVEIDGDCQTITCTGGLNLYPNCNYKFLRLKRGYNMLVATGIGVLRLICEFPVNIGG